MSDDARKRAREAARKLREQARRLEKAAGANSSADSSQHRDMPNPNYADHKQRMAAVERAKSASGRDIGEVPDIANLERRERTRRDLRLFCETYNPEPFYFAWSDFQIRSIRMLEEAAIHGAMYAFAEPRGSGKSLRVKMAALWAIAHHWRNYVFIIGANASKAREALDAIKVYCRFLPLFSADFPEITFAVKQLNGIVNRAAGQTSQGHPTMIRWSEDQIILPTVLPPKNWPKEWPLRRDGFVPTSGAIVTTSGLTGEGIRGSSLTLTTGEVIRPDLVLLDDPQTNESASNPLQNEKREHLISADVLGMAGPGKTISAVMPCTVIAKGDMVDRILNRELHPLWRGERSSLLVTMPTNMVAWDQYFEVFRECMTTSPPDYQRANDYYIANRDELDEGAEASWPARKLDHEVSAIQSAMHLYYRDPEAFFSEYQNDPKQKNQGESDHKLIPEMVQAKFSNAPRYACPRGTTRLTAFVDVGVHLLWYCVVAWDESFNGMIVDYGCFPEQSRSYFSSTDPNPSLGDLPEYRGQSQEVSIYGGLKSVTQHILGGDYLIEDTDAKIMVDKCLIDANWGPGTDLVYDFCVRSEFRNIIVPSHGKFVGASSNPMAAWTKKPGERVGWHWRLSAPQQGRGRHVVFDTNHYKSFTSERIRTPDGAKGCLRIHEPEIGNHRLLVEHLTSEYPVEVSQKGNRVVNEWKRYPNRENHWWDCLVGCCVAASLAGLIWSTGEAAGEQPRGVTKRRVTPEEFAAASRAKLGKRQ